MHWEVGNICKIQYRNLEEIHHSRDAGKCKGMRLKWILELLGMGMLVNFRLFTIGSRVEGSW
jgi:hypothetical protein